MSSNFQQFRSVREDIRSDLNKFRAGVLAPVMAVNVGQSESGVLSQSFRIKLAPVAGEVVTPVHARIISVFVPVQAIDALKNPDETLAGSGDLIRSKIISGNPLFGLEEEGELTKRMCINPRSIDGVKSVNEMARGAHNCAINFLRQRLYVKAGLLDWDNEAVTPALLSSTALTRLNSVLDPEDRVNGAVDLDLSNIEIPVFGLGIKDDSRGEGFTYQTGIRQSNVQGAADVSHSGNFMEVGNSNTDTTVAGDYGGTVQESDSLFIAQDPDNASFPKIFAQIVDGKAGEISMLDFERAEIMDALTRRMRQIVDADPEYGEEQVAAWMNGLNLPAGHHPRIIHEKSAIFGLDYSQATDGASLDVSQSDFIFDHSFTAVVPRTEFGGVIVTFAVVHPEEVISSQPHPSFTVPYGSHNYVADEMRLNDPVPVTMRELDSEVPEELEGTVAMYSGLNALPERYSSYGLNRNLDPSTVENKTRMWTFAIPLSVSPENILYPVDLDQYPFQDQNSDIATCFTQSRWKANSPIAVGATPVEELASIEEQDVFEDVVE